MADDLEALEMGLIFNPVVRHTDTGRPVTLRQQTIINMAKKIVEIRRKSGDDTQDLKIRAKAAAELQARQKTVADRIAAGEKIVTKNFIIPGTTPQESRRIHSDDSGLRVADAKDGSSRTQYVVKGNLFEDNADQTCAIGESWIGPLSAKESTQKETMAPASQPQTQTQSLSSYQDVRVTRKKITREQAEELARERGDGINELTPEKPGKPGGTASTTRQRPVIRTSTHPGNERNEGLLSQRSGVRASGSKLEGSDNNDIDIDVKADEVDVIDEVETEEDLTAEEIYRRYFPDASLSPTKGWRGIVEELFGIFASPVAASSMSSTSSISPLCQNTSY